MTRTVPTADARLRVAYVTMAFPAAPETFATNDVLALRRSGVDVAVHALRPAVRDAARLLAERDLLDLPVTHNGVRATLAGVGAILARPGRALELAGWIARHTWRRPTQLLRSLMVVPRAVDVYRHIEVERPDVVHLFWGHYPAIVARLVQRYSPDIVVSMFLGAHDLRVRYGGSGPVARSADVVWTHTAANVPIIRALGVTGDGPVVAYRGVDLRRLRDVAARTPKTPKRVVTAGRLVPSKGIDDVLRGFARVVAAHPDATLTVLGDGPEKSALERLAASLGVRDSVRFRGHQPQEQAFQEMAQAEVLLFLSRVESLPNVIKEAMAVGTVCVSSKTSGIEELVSDGEHGFLVDHGDVEAAAVAVSRLLSDVGLRTQMAEAARRHVEAHFDLERTMARYRDTWVELVRSRRNSAEA